MNEVWTRWQGHVINGAFALRRFLGSSDHSAVFLTEVAGPEPREAALKLVPAHPARASLQLAHWNMAGGLAHPHLIRLVEIGRCQLGGLPYLYAVMEHADQTLAQLLRQRALTEDETREMLLPAVSVLAYLHKKNLVQGQLKPANILAVGDDLKLASDTIRPAGEATVSLNMPSVYDPPEARQGSRSTAGDIWALGVTLFESLTRSPPAGLDERDGAYALPPDFSPAFRDLVARCLCRRPHDRPGITEIEDWMRGAGATSASAGAAPVTAESIASQAARPPPVREQGAPASAAAAAEIPQAIVAHAAAPVSISPDRTGSAESWQGAEIRAVVQRYIAALLPSNWRSLAPAPLILGAVAVLALGWTGVRLLSGHSSPAPPVAQTPRQAPPLQAASVVPPVTPPNAPSSYRVAASDPKQGQIERASPSPSGLHTEILHEEMPDVPRSARRTIRGHIKVYVRLIVEKDGTVYAALADRAGPSRYFERLAIDAAKKWTFTPVDDEAPRLMQVRFDFSRRGTTGHAVTLHQVAARAP